MILSLQPILTILLPWRSSVTERRQSVGDGRLIRVALGGTEVQNSAFNLWGVCVDFFSRLAAFYGLGA